MSLLKLFCSVDDFMLSFTPHWRTTQIAAGKQRQRAGALWPSEIITILIHFHQSHYRTFKAYYTEYVQVHLTSVFPSLVSYTRFVALIPRMMVPYFKLARQWTRERTGRKGLTSCRCKRRSQRIFCTKCRTIPTP